MKARSGASPQDWSMQLPPKVRPALAAIAKGANSGGYELKITLSTPDEVRR